MIGGPSGVIGRRHDRMRARSQSTAPGKISRPVLRMLEKSEYFQSRLKPANSAVEETRSSSPKRDHATRVASSTPPTWGAAAGSRMSAVSEYPFAGYIG